MSDSDLHGVNGYMNWYEDDDEYTYPAPALPSYGDVLAALGNPSDPLTAIAALQHDALAWQLLSAVEVQYSVTFYFDRMNLAWQVKLERTPQYTRLQGERVCLGSGETRLEALRAAVAAMEADRGNN